MYIHTYMYTYIHIHIHIHIHIYTHFGGWWITIAGWAPRGLSRFLRTSRGNKHHDFVLLTGLAFTFPEKKSEPTGPARRPFAARAAPRPHRFTLCEEFARLS